MASKVIIVTGASRGIGLAVAKYLLNASHKVVLVSRTATVLEALEAQYPAQVQFLAADLTNMAVGALFGPPLGHGGAGRIGKAQEATKRKRAKLPIGSAQDNRTCCQILWPAGRNCHQPRRAHAYETYRELNSGGMEANL